jgi:NADH-quinone oxidoreductase subunit K/multicomponent Na+:H+ antiporter subunit C
MSISPVAVLWVGAAVLLLVGLYGLLVVRNLFQIIIAVQLLGKAVVLALVLAGRTSGQINLGQSLAATVIVADTIVTVIGLSFVIQIKRRMGTVDVKELATLKG